MIPPAEGHVWPDAAQSLLLTAALGERAQALEAYRQWRATVRLEDHFDAGSYRLLPLLHENLSRFGVQDDFTGRLRGIHRHAWAESQKRLADADEAIQILDRAGIPTLVLKGLALGGPFYGRQGVRPMTDIDILVPLDRRIAASEALNAAGWVSYARDWNVPGDLSHAQGHYDARKHQLDLHWRMYIECASPFAAAHVWEKALPHQIRQTPTLRPCAADLLLHTLIHGLRLNAEPSIRWIADAVMILRGSEQIDWERLIAFAEAQSLTARTRLAFEWLDGRYGVTMPPEVMVRLARCGPDLFESLEARILVNGRTPGLTGWIQGRIAYYGRLWASFGARAAGATLFRGLAVRVRNGGRAPRRDPAEGAPA